MSISPLELLHVLRNSDDEYSKKQEAEAALRKETETKFKLEIEEFINSKLCRSIEHRPQGNCWLVYITCKDSYIQFFQGSVNFKTFILNNIDFPDGFFTEVGDQVSRKFGINHQYPCIPLKFTLI